MNGDGRNDVGVGNDWGFFVLDGLTGNELYSVNEFYSFEAAGAVGNFGSLGWRLDRLRVRHAEQPDAHPGVPDPDSRA